MEEEKILSKKEQKRLKKEEKLRKKEEKRKEKFERESNAFKVFPVNKKGYHILPFMNVMRVLFTPIHWIFFPYKLHGNKKVGKGACIYVGVHYAIWDIFYPACTTWEGIHFVSKDSVMHWPVLGRWARRMAVISAQRDGSDVRTLMNALKALKNGDKVSLFPEGTRNKSEGDEFLPFHGGAALMSIKTKSPIVPFVACNRPRLFRMTHVVFGEPMEFTEYYGKKLSAEDYEEAEKKLRERMYAIREEFRAKKRAKKERKKKV